MDELIEDRKTAMLNEESMAASVIDNDGTNALMDIIKKDPKLKA